MKPALGAMMLLASLPAAGLRAQAPEAIPFAPVGLFIARIEEGARIFTPVRLLPMEHPEALGHQFPTVLQLHGTEFPVLIWLGEQAGFRLWATLQRYPAEPDSSWPYQGFRQPPDSDQLRAARIVHRPDATAPLPGLRAVLYFSRAPVAFLVDTRPLSLKARGMKTPTTMGLDLSRADFLQGLQKAGQEVPPLGLAAVVYDP